MNEEQVEIYQRLQEPFPQDAYKQVTLGNREFTTIDAYHIIDRLNQLFGFCGTGWAIEDVQFSVEEAAAKKKGYNGQPDSVSQVLTVSCSARLVIPSIGVNVPAVGDGAVIGGNIAEAKKKAQTNFISKASSFIGVGLSVYMGLHDSDPYLDRQAQQQPQSSQGQGFMNQRAGQPTQSPAPVQQAQQPARRPLPQQQARPVNTSPSRLSF